MANAGESLESRFAEMALDLAKEAGRFMEPESYGQWADLPYQAMAAAAEIDALSSQTVQTSAPMMSTPSAMGQTAATYDRIFDTQMVSAHGDSTTMSDSLYFMAEIAKPFYKDVAPGTKHSSNPLPMKHANVLGRVEGLDVLDPHFLCGMVNDIFRDQMEPYGMFSASAMAGEASAAYASLPYFLTEAATPASSGNARGVLDVESIRRDFPILQRKIHGKPLIWLDNGATTQKPQVVIDRITRFYEHENSNVHRGAHTLAAEATDAYEGARCKVAAFLGAALPEEIIFVRGTTEGINLIANICGEKFLSPGDEILLTEVEHHANIVPWQFIARKTGAVIRVAPIDDSGELILEAFAHLLGPRTKIVSMTHVSNALGTVMPIQEMTRMAKSYGAIVVVDGAQGVPHRRVNVLDIGCDFYVFSGHKLFGPTGIGAVYGRKDLLEQLSPWQGGGSMIKHVTFEKSTFGGLPNKFEAGTGSLASAIGLGTAIDYVMGLGLEVIEQYETDLVNYAVDEIRRVKGVRMIGMPKDRAGVISFVMAGVPVTEVGTLLDAEGIAVRAGHHCAQPALAHYGLESTIRPAFAFYNTKAEADALVEALHKISSRH